MKLIRRSKFMIIKFNLSFFKTIVSSSVVLIL